MDNMLVFSDSGFLSKLSKHFGKGRYLEYDIIEYLRKINISVILYTHYLKKRETNFSRSNQLLKVVNNYVEITKKDFENAP